ncbi:hypothetical protein CBF53_07940 [Lactobacillus taiwanensis]|uniref:HTH cro/C1-type domain-containing protein n=1 Tax=Lactobacillus taiwanensis TaxID=508451 RepID=A0ABX4ENC7_9LACO|nr:helix-turn-helix transcriptional regulator [Lactobacillus taiwanensis]OYR87372.1 hypothetical protein CBF53_07940 [Lactobacillus taiwanensis]
MKNRIKELRQNRKLSQNDIAKLLGVTRQAVSLYEQGKRQLNKNNIDTLAKYFNVSALYLQGYLIAECRWCGNKFVLTSDKDKDRYFYCPFCGRSPLTLKTK